MLKQKLTLSKADVRSNNDVPMLSAIGSEGGRDAEDSTSHDNFVFVDASALEA